MAAADMELHRLGVVTSVDPPEEDNTQAAAALGDLLASDPHDPEWNLPGHLKKVQNAGRETGWEFIRLGVAWRGLTLTAKVNANSEVATVGGIVRDTVLCRGKEGRTKTVLNDVCGYCRPGEMLLVIGPPNSGCTSLLKTIYGDSTGLERTGEVLYNRSPDFAQFKRMVHMVQASDVHSAPLTVGKTLRFAVECSLPSEMPSRTEMVEQYTTILLRILGLSHVKDSVVGDDVLRGVSGGEKKRVTIGEMLGTRSSMLLLDEYTRGLDSAAALDIVKAIRTAVQNLGIAVIATQYQASQEIYDLFDNVLVLKEGRTIYFGPTSQAQAYFLGHRIISPSNATVPDFLTKLAAEGPEPTIELAASELPGLEGPGPHTVLATTVLGVREALGLDGEVIHSFEAGDLITVYETERREDCLFGLTMQGWVVLADSRGTHADKLLAGDDVLFGCSGTSRVANGVYEIAEAAEPGARPRFIRRGGNGDLRGDQEVVLQFDPARGAWIVSFADNVEYPIAMARSDVDHPNAVEAPWLVRSEDGGMVVDEDAHFTTFAEEVPASAEELAATFKTSRFYKQFEAGMPLACPEHPVQWTPEVQRAMTRPYARAWGQQVGLLVSRKVSILRKDPQQIRSRLGRFIMIGLVIGLLFRDLGNSFDDMYARAGLLFFSMLFCSLSSFSELPALVESRAVFMKHREARLYSPSAYFMAINMVDIPFVLVETMGFAATVFFLTGMNEAQNGLRFFYFWVTVLFLDITFVNFTRMWSAIGDNVAMAQAMGMGAAVVLLLNSGFALALDDIPWYFRWIAYINPFRFAFEGLVLNEYDGLVAEQGTQTIDGLQYLDLNYGIDYSDPELIKWLWLLVIVGWGMFFVAMAIVALTVRKVSDSSAGGTIQTAHHRRSSLPELLNAAKSRRQSSNTLPGVEAPSTDGDGVTVRTQSYMAAVEQGTDTGSTGTETVVQVPQSAGALGESVQPAYLTWENIVYEVDVASEEARAPKRRLKLLNNVTGFTRPGELTALMGSSGAGKTTLLDVLARRKTGGYIHGDIKINGRAQDATFKRFSGYVEQTDIHSPRTTVYEALMFSAMLRLPSSVSASERKRRVVDTALLLGLADYLNAVVGEPDQAGSLPPEIRKTLTIAVEVVAEPAILFLDEPTSGLATGGALIVMEAIRAIADSGRAVVCTIHQPSAELFSFFDRLLLMQRGGRTVYFGPLGPKCDTLLHYFYNQGAPHLAFRQNPADYILEQIGAGIGHTIEKDWSHTWSLSQEKRDMINEMHETDFIPRSTRPFVFATILATDMFTQFAKQLKRCLRTYWRNPSYNLVRIVFAVVIALLLGLLYLDVGDSQADLRARATVLFFASIMGIVSALNAIPVMIGDRAVFYRERASGCYTSYSYWMATFAVETPFIILQALTFCVVFYWLVGLRTSQFGFFLLMMATFFFFCVSYGQVVAVWAPNGTVAQLVAPAVLSLFSMMSGFLITRSNIPPYFIWIHYLSPFTYFIEASLINEVEGQTYSCAPNELQCFQTGEQFLDFYDMDTSYKWRDWGILVALFAALRILTLIGVEFKVQISR